MRLVQKPSFIRLYKKLRATDRGQVNDAIRTAMTDRRPVTGKPVIWPMCVF